MNVECIDLTQTSPPGSPPPPLPCSPPPSPGSVSCAICLTEKVPTKGKALVLQCLHPFCTTCIEAWAQRSRSCPLCKGHMEAYLKDITSDTSYKEVRLPPLPPPTHPFASINSGNRRTLLDTLLDGGGAGIPAYNTSPLAEALLRLAYLRSYSWEDVGRRRPQPRGLAFGAPPPPSSHPHRGPGPSLGDGDTSDELEDLEAMLENTAPWNSSRHQPFAGRAASRAGQRRRTRSLSHDFEEALDQDPSIGRRRMQGGTSSGSGSSAAAAAAAAAAATAAALGREERGRRRQPTPYFLRLHRGITAGMTRSSQASPLDGMYPPHSSAGAALPHPAPPPPLNASTLRSSLPLGMCLPRPLPQSLSSSLSFSSLLPAPGTWPHQAAAPAVSSHPLTMPPPSSAATTAHLVTPSPPQAVGATLRGYVGTVAWRRSIYERGLYAQPAGAARGRRVAAAAAAAAGGRQPSAARLRWGAGPDGDGPEYSLKYVAGWIERELRALLMEEDVSIVCAFVQGLLRSHGLQPQSEQHLATAPTQVAPAAAPLSSPPLAPPAAAPEPASPSFSACRPWTASHAHSAARSAALTPSTSARGAWGRGGRSRVFAGDEDFEFEDDDQYGGSSRRHASGAVTSFEDGLRPFLGDRTQHFMHELRNFAASHLTIQAYDSAVVYQPGGPTSGSPSAVRQQAQHTPAAPLVTAAPTVTSGCETLLPCHRGTNTSAACPATAPTPLPGHPARMRLRGWDVGPTSSTSVSPSVSTHQLHPTDTTLRSRPFSEPPPPLQHATAHAATDLSQSQVPQSAALRTAAECEEAAEAPLGVHSLPRPPQSTAVQTAAAWEEAAEAPLGSTRPWSGVPGVPVNGRDGAVGSSVPAHVRRHGSAEDTRGGEDTAVSSVRGLGSRPGGPLPLRSAATAGRKRARSPDREAREGGSRRLRVAAETVLGRSEYRRDESGLRLGGAEEQEYRGPMQRRSELTQRRQNLERQITEVRRRREMEEQDEGMGRGWEQQQAGQRSGEGGGVEGDQEEERDEGMVGLQELRQRALRATASLVQRRRQLVGQQGAAGATGRGASSRDVGSDRWDMV